LRFSLLLLQTVTGTLVPKVEEVGKQFSVGGQDVDSPSDSLSSRLYSAEARSTFASCSSDGSFKVWDIREKETMEWCNNDPAHK
jgi:WD40 repeat protein